MRNYRTWIQAGRALATAILASVALPALAHAQYTLSFDPDAQVSGTTICPAGYAVGCSVSATYGTVANLVNVSDGTMANFGSKKLAAPALIIDSGSVVGDNSNGAYINAKGDVGAFEFTTVDPNEFFSVTSLDVGLSSAAACSGKSCKDGGDENFEVEIYSADNSTLLWDSGDFVMTPGTNEVITVPASLASGVQGGLRLEFGPDNGLATPNGTYFTVDDITYDVSAYAPEPGTILLLGTGLTLLFPAARRRRA